MKATLLLDILFQSTPGELWGLASCSNGHEFVTASVDGTLCCWNSTDKRLVCCCYFFVVCLFVCLLICLVVCLLLFGV